MSMPIKQGEQFMFATEGCCEDNIYSGPYLALQPFDLAERIEKLGETATWFDLVDHLTVDGLIERVELPTYVVGDYSLKAPSRRGA